MQFRVIVVTDPKTQTNPQTGPITIHSAAAQCNKKVILLCKGQRSRSLGRFTHRGINASVSCSGEHGNVLGVGSYYYDAVCSAARGASAPTEGEEGRDISWWQPAYSLLNTKNWDALHHLGSYSSCRKASLRVQRISLRTETRSSKAGSRMFLIDRLSSGLQKRFF